MKKKFYQANIEVDSRSAGRRIDHFLNNYIQKGGLAAEDIDVVFSRTTIQKFIKDGNILVNDVLVKQSYITREGDILALNIPVEYGSRLDVIPERIYMPIVYNDRDLVVINKPMGLVVHPAHGHYSHTLINGLLYLFPELIKNTNLYRMGLVHRLDKDTSGLIIITKNEMAQQYIAAQFKQRTIKKEYVAIVSGRMEKDEDEIYTRIGRNPINRQRMTVLITNGKEAVTRYQVLKYLQSGTFVRLLPLTGRMHQLRVHMRYLHHPVIGDNFYAGKKTEFHFLGMMLHARKIRFNHPRTNKEIEFETALPERFQILLEKG